MKKPVLDYLFTCHKMPSRSFFYKGKQFPLCSRCTGILIGYILGIILLILGIFFPLIPNIWITIILFIPMGIDGLIQYYTKYESTNIKRLLTGILGGIAIILIIYHTAVFGFHTGRQFSKKIFK